MHFKIHKNNDLSIAELSGTGQLINNLDDALDLLGNANYSGARKIIVHQSQLHPDFFELRTGMAGEILQKFSNYRMQLAIVGAFGKISSKSLRDFIYESNKNGHIQFLASTEEAINKLSGA